MEYRNDQSWMLDPQKPAAKFCIKLTQIDFIWHFVFFGASEHFFTSRELGLIVLTQSKSLWDSRISWTSSRGERVHFIVLWRTRNSLSMVRQLNLLISFQNVTYSSKADLSRSCKLATAYRPGCTDGLHSHRGSNGDSGWNYTCHVSKHFYSYARRELKTLIVLDFKPSVIKWWSKESPNFPKATETASLRRKYTRAVVSSFWSNLALWLYDLLQ